MICELLTEPSIYVYLESDASGVIGILLTPEPPVAFIVFERRSR